MIKCDKCGSPNVLSRIVIHGEKDHEELNLCPVCFQKFVKDHPELKNGAMGQSLNHILTETLKMLNSGLFGTNPGALKHPAPGGTVSVRQCPKCSTPEFRISKGTAGCEQCYDFFAGEIDRYLFRETGTSVKIRSGKKVSAKEAKISLQEKLQKAVATDNFELAAAVRDELKKLKN